MDLINKHFFKNKNYICIHLKIKITFFKLFQYIYIYYVVNIIIIFISNIVREQVFLHKSHLKPIVMLASWEIKKLSNLF